MERTSSKTSSSLDSVRLEFGRITNIYPDRGTVDWRSEMSEQPRYDIPYTMPYFDQIEGTGITFNPEPGSTAICCTSSDGKSFILAFLGADETGSYLGGRPKGNPGDISLTGRDGNFTILRRGGIVQIGAKPLCQSVYLPVRNIIQHFCENFEIYSLAGELKFNVERPEDNSDGHSKTSYSVTVKEFADDKSEIVAIKIGSQANSDIFTLVTKDKGGGTIKINLAADKDGNLTISIAKNLSITVKGDTKLETSGDTKLSSKGNIESKATGDHTIEGRNLTIKGNGTGDISTSGALTIKGSTVRIGDGLYPVLRLSPDMITFLSAVAGLVSGAGVNPPTLHFDTKVLV